MPLWALWGDHLDKKKKNFEWPTQELFNQLPPDIFLESIRLASYNGGMCLAQCTLSRNKKQPLLKSGYNYRLGDLKDLKVLKFDRNKKVKSVKVVPRSHISFVDKGGSTIASFRSKDALYNQSEEETHSIGNNEELIGVYGVKSKYLLSPFGFIVKVRLN